MGEKRVFVVSFGRMLHEAQNTLLKILEEPPEHTYFFLITGRADILAPTLRSRFVTVSITDEEDSNEDMKKFLKKTPSERLKEIVPLIEAVAETGDKTPVLVFLNNLERELAKNKEFKTKHPEIFEDIIKTRNYLYDRAPSVKMILEHLSVILPNQK